MSNLNKVTLQGNLTRDPEIRFSQAGTAIAKFGLAVNNHFGDKETTVFVDCVSFGKQAEVIGQHVKKGQQVLISGKLHLDSWEDKTTKEKRSKLLVHLSPVEGFFFVGSKKVTSQEPTVVDAESPAASDPDPLF